MSQRAGNFIPVSSHLMAYYYVEEMEAELTETEMLMGEISASVRENLPKVIACMHAQSSVPFLAMSHASSSLGLVCCLFVCFKGNWTLKQHHIQHGSDLHPCLSQIR